MAGRCDDAGFSSRGAGRPTNLDKSRATANFACSRFGWGLIGLFFSIVYRFSLFSLRLPLREMAR